MYRVELKDSAAKGPLNTGEEFLMYRVELKVKVFKLQLCPFESFLMYRVELKVILAILPPIELRRS